MSQKAEIATVKLGHLEFEGLMTNSGNFYIAISQLVSLNLVPPNRSLKQLETLLGISFPSHEKLKTPLNSKYINAINLIDFERLLRTLDRRGVQSAQTIVDQLVGLVLEQLFSDAFCIKFDKEDRQQWLKTRQSGKVVRRTLTDAIKDYLIATKTEDKYLYCNVTEAIYLGIFNRRAANLRVDWNTESPRDCMTDKELRHVGQVEDLTMRLIDSDRLHPMLAVKEALNRLIIPVCER